MSELIISGLHKRFGSVQAVEELSICVNHGQRLVILGPSGCGKTTALRLIAGLEKPDGGSVHRGDQDLVLLEPAERDVAMIFQDAALYPHLNVRANLAFSLRSKRLATAEIEARIAQTSAAFEITELLDRYPQSLSGGQRSRVAFARGIIKRPALLLLDEPLSGLDPPLRWQLQTQWLSWHDRFPTTTIHVTHDQQEAMLLGDSIAVMRAGVIEQVGTPLQLYRHPLNRFVASFIGSPGMNFVSAVVNGGVLKIGSMTIMRPEAIGATAGWVDIGARPEAIRLIADDAASADQSEHVVIDAVIESVRPTGAQWLIGVTWQDNLWWVSSARGERLNVGQRVRMLIEPADLYCFPSTAVNAIAAD